MEKAKTADDSLAKIEAAVQMWEASQKRQELEVLLERARKSPHVIPSAVAKLELLLAQSQTTTRELLHIAAKAIEIHRWASEEERGNYAATMPADLSVQIKR